MGSLSSKHCGIKYLLCVIDLFIKYAWVRPLKDKKAKTVLHGFIIIANTFKSKTNKVWVDQGKEFQKSLMQKWLGDIDILMYSTHNEGKLVVVERFIKTLKGKIYKKMTANDNKCYVGYLNKIVDEYNNSYYHSIDKKPIDPDYSALTEEIESSHQALEFKVGDTVTISRYKNIFSKRLHQ